MSDINTSETINMKAFSSIPVVDTYANIMSVENSKPGGIVLNKGVPVLATNSPDGSDVLIIGDGLSNITSIKKYTLMTSDGLNKKIYLIQFPSSIDPSISRTFTGDAGNSRMIDIMGAFLNDGSGIKIVGSNKDIDHPFAITSVNFVKSTPTAQPASYGSVTITVDPSSPNVTSEFMPWFVIEDLGKFTSVMLQFANDVGEELDELAVQVETNTNNITTLTTQVAQKVEKSNIKPGSANVTITPDASTNDVTIDVVLPPATTQLLVKSTDGSIIVDTSTANEADISLADIKLTLTDSAVPSNIKDIETSLKDILEDIYSRLNGFISVDDVVKSTTILATDADLQYVTTP